MLHQPTRFIHGQALHPDSLNAILDTLRRITPIQGPGISLSQSPNGIVISATNRNSAPQTIITPQTVETLRPLTIRKFEIEETQADGSIATTTKWGLYLPDNCISLLWRDETEIVSLAFSSFWVEKVDPGSCVPGAADWLDITAPLQEIASKGYAYLAVSLSLEGSSNRTCTLSIAAAESTDTKAYNSDDGMSGIGYIIPIAKLSLNSDGTPSVSQFRYGPMLETIATEGSHLMERASVPASQNISEWSLTQDGAELSEDKTYALIGQVYTHLKIFTETGDEVASSARRHEKDWIDLGNIVYVKPLVFANFGAQIQ